MQLSWKGTSCHWILMDFTQCWMPIGNDMGVAASSFALEIFGSKPERLLNVLMDLAAILGSSPSVALISKGFEGFRKIGLSPNHPKLQNWTILSFETHGLGILHCKETEFVWLVDCILLVACFIHPREQETST